ncbi:MAG: hypothetical protein NT003_04985 [Candidatus Magasanikbacteria bacterium]|nr:hypothetical protein [Candidatus Magasanikbacteria bacterium]
MIINQDREEADYAKKSNAKYIAELLDSEADDDSKPDAILTAARAAYEWLKKNPTPLEKFEWIVLEHLLFQGSLHTRFRRYADEKLELALTGVQQILFGLVEEDEVWAVMLLMNLAKGVADLSSEDQGVHHITSGFFADLHKQDLKELQIQTSEDLYVRFRLYCRYAMTRHVILPLLKTDIQSLVEEIVRVAAPLMIQGPFLQELKDYFESVDDPNALYTGDGPNNCIAEYGMREAALQNPKFREIFELGPVPAQE